MAATKKVQAESNVDGYFRANVGAVVINDNKKVLALRRKNVPEAVWQMPQGGVGFNEVPVEAVWRELQEETGLTRYDVELLAAADDWIVYELPKQFRSAKVGWGQAQRWFLFRARPGSTVKPDGKEFEAYDWFTVSELLDRVIAFRAPVYRRVFAEFADWV